MPYTDQRPIETCSICASQANVYDRQFGVGEIVDCSRCGDFQISHIVASDFGLPYTTPRERAIASHAIRRMQAPRSRPVLTAEFLHALKTRRIPNPTEACDNLIMWLGESVGEKFGDYAVITYGEPALLGALGVIQAHDVRWIVTTLADEGRIRITSVEGATCRVVMTASGWLHFEELKRTRISSRFAFFARQFTNADLDMVYEQCLRPAVSQTGFELRTVTQRAGLVDSIIEDEIRRCRFVVADLSDDNAGAYWEGGFAEGLGKPVIYLCCAAKNGKAKRTHFDADHRHTVRWDLASLDQTARILKAVIRNTLLGDANQFN